MSDIEALKEIVKDVNGDIKTLTERIGELVTAIARKDVRDDHIEKSMSDIDTKIESMTSRIVDLEKAQSGDDARREFSSHAKKVAIGAVVMAIIGAAFAAYTS